jgi:hypothetical protein
MVDAPTGSTGELVIWDPGSAEMIVVDGTGGFYSPAVDSWRPMSMENKPKQLVGEAVWTGTDLILGTGRYFSRLQMKF